MFILLSEEKAEAFTSVPFISYTLLGDWDHSCRLDLFGTGVGGDTFLFLWSLIYYLQSGGYKVAVDAPQVQSVMRQEARKSLL